MFNKQIMHYKNRFEECKNALSGEYLEAVTRSLGYDLANLKSDFENNTETFQKLATVLAKQVQKGTLMPYTYSAAVAVIAESLGVSYTLKSGFCIPKDSPKFDEEIRRFNEGKKSAEHPSIATHFYVVANDKEYEYYSGRYSDIEKIDVIDVM